MSQKSEQIVITVQCGATLAAAALAAPASFQYSIVSLDADGKLATPANATTVTSRPIGILQSKPIATNEACRVAIAGTSKLKMSESCDEGEGIAPDAGGLGQGMVTGAANEYLIGLALEAASTNDRVEVLLCVGAHSAEDESA